MYEVFWPSLEPDLLGLEKPSMLGYPEKTTFAYIQILRVLLCFLVGLSCKFRESAWENKFFKRKDKHGLVPNEIFTEK